MAGPSLISLRTVTGGLCGNAHTPAAMYGAGSRVAHQVRRAEASVLCAYYGLGSGGEFCAFPGVSLHG